MVFWSFFGVRKRSDHERDALQVRPWHVVVAAIAGVAVFVAVLILIVQGVVR